MSNKNALRTLTRRDLLRFLLPVTEAKLVIKALGGNVEINNKDAVALGFHALALAAACNPVVAASPLTETPTAAAVASMTPAQIETLQATLTPAQLEALGIPTAPATPAATPQATATATPGADKPPGGEPPQVVEVLKPAETLREAGARIGFDIGYQFMAADQLSFKQSYEDQAKRAFATIQTNNELAPEFVEKYKTDGVRRVVDLSNRGKQTVVVSNFFDRRKTKSDFANMDTAGVEARMRSRLASAFDELKKVTKRPIYFGGLHEILEYNPTNGVMDLAPDDPLVRAFTAEKAMGKTTQIMIEEGEKAGLIKFSSDRKHIERCDLVCMVGMSQLFAHDPFFEYAMLEFDKAKQEAADAFGIPLAEVPMGILAEVHAYAKDTPFVRGHDPQRTRGEYTDMFKKMTASGPVYMAEVEIQNADGNKIVDFYTDLAYAGQESRALGMNIWRGNVACTATTDPGWCDPRGNLFDDRGQPTEVHNSFLANLNSMKPLPLKVKS